MKNALLVVVAMLALSACEKIEVGNVGIKINTTGDIRGVENAPVVSGWVMYNMFTQDVVEFPGTVQTVTYAKGADGEPDNSINFASSEGLTINADVSLSYHIDPVKVPHLYARFRQEDLDIFAHSYLQRVVRDSLNEQASKITVYDIYGAGKSAFIEAARAFLADKIESDGIVIDQLTFTSAPRLPANVQTAINNQIAATQNAQVAQNRVAQITAEAAQKVAQAKGDAEAKMMAAKADADSVLLRAKAQAEANQLLQKSLTPALIESARVSKWDGKLPMFGDAKGTSIIVDTRPAAIKTAM